MREKFGLLASGCLLVILPLLAHVQPAKAAGASYYFSPSTIRLNVGQTTTVTLYVAAPDQTITAGDGTIVLPAQVTASNVSKSGSVFSLWPEEPGVNGSTIRFAGGKPSPGFQGASGKILSFTVRGTTEGTGLITPSGGRILYNDTNVYTGASNATAIVTRVVSGATISSTTHPNPDAWYKARDAALTWSKPSGASTYSYTLSHDGGQPTKSGSGASTSANFSGLADGVWTFSLTTTFSDGKTAASRYTIRVDTSPPAAFSFTTERQNGASDPSPVIKYTTTDTPSGVASYEIILNGTSIAKVTDTTFKIPQQKPGKYSLVVRAADHAGNTTDATGTFNVEGFAGPVITKWPSITNVLEPIFLKGEARYDSKVFLYIDGQKVAEFIVKDNLSDDAKRAVDTATIQPDARVEWSYTHRGLITRGSHLIYAEQQRPDGALSNRSNEVKTFVLWTTIYMFGIPIPTIFLGIVVIIILTGLLILTNIHFRKIIAAIRRRVRQTEEEVDADLIQLEEQLGKDGSRFRGSVETARSTVGRELDSILRKPNNKDGTKK